MARIRKTRLELQEKLGLAFFLGLLFSKTNKKGQAKTVIDLRGPAQEKLASREANSGEEFYRRGERDLRKLDGLVLHQWASVEAPTRRSIWEFPRIT